MPVTSVVLYTCTSSLAEVGHWPGFQETLVPDACYFQEKAHGVSTLVEHTWSTTQEEQSTIDSTFLFELQMQDVIQSYIYENNKKSSKSDEKETTTEIKTSTDQQVSWKQPRCL
jgi:hypothetical protein